MSYRGPMTRAVASALNSAEIAPRDEGAVALARRYAALIDEAAPAAKYRKALERLGRSVALYAADEDDGEQVAEAFETIRAALAAHSVASDLGPKLLAALTALGLTLAGRGSGKGGIDESRPRASKLDELKARRATRAHRAASVDAAP